MDKTLPSGFLNAVPYGSECPVMGQIYCLQFYYKIKYFKLQIILVNDTRCFARNLYLQRALLLKVDHHLNRNQADQKRC